MTESKRVRNWKDYNRNAIKSGAITLWIDRTVITALPVKSHARGRPRIYSNELIEASLLLKHAYQLSFRKVQGFIGSLYELLGVIKQPPNYSVLCRRQIGLSVNLKKCVSSGPINIVIDSTGLKVVGEGEWCRKKHGFHYQRTWKKIHLAVDADGLDIVSCVVSSARTQDSDVLQPLLEDVKAPIKTVIGDGAYDTFKCYEYVHQRKARAIFPPRVDARHSSETRADKKAACKEAIEQRDEAIIRIAQSDRPTWKKEVGYHKRSLAETTMYRLKTHTGEKLKARHLETQILEVKIKCKILNKINALADSAY